jgi:EAL domain-containing protein (putative c-di-GMP-specific phosphodiesterase class I)
VDRSFTADIATDDRALGIIRHIIHLGRELGLRVVAEGVEDERTLRILRSIDCEVVQGFHLARPMPEEQLRCWVAKASTYR